VILEEYAQIQHDDAGILEACAETLAGCAEILEAFCIAIEDQRASLREYAASAAGHVPALEEYASILAGHGAIAKAHMPRAASCASIEPEELSPNPHREPHWADVCAAQSGHGAGDIEHAAPAAGPPATATTRGAKRHEFPNPFIRVPPALPATLDRVTWDHLSGLHSQQMRDHLQVHATLNFCREFLAPFRRWRSAPASCATSRSDLDPRRSANTGRARSPRRAVTINIPVPIGAGFTT
jgi:hypothetical protein